MATEPGYRNNHSSKATHASAPKLVRNKSWLPYQTIHKLLHTMSVTIYCTEYFIFNKVCMETLYGYRRNTHKGNDEFGVAILCKKVNKKLPNPASWASNEFLEWTT